MTRRASRRWRLDIPNIPATYLCLFGAAEPWSAAATTPLSTAAELPAHARPHAIVAAKAVALLPHSKAPAARNLGTPETRRASRRAGCHQRRMRTVGATSGRDAALRCNVGAHFPTPCGPGCNTRGRLLRCSPEPRSPITAAICQPSATSHFDTRYSSLVIHLSLIHI